MVVEHKPLGNGKGKASACGIGSMPERQARWSLLRCGAALFVWCGGFTLHR